MLSEPWLCCHEPSPGEVWSRHSSANLNEKVSSGYCIKHYLSSCLCNSFFVLNSAGLHSAKVFPVMCCQRPSQKSFLLRWWYVEKTSCKYLSLVYRFTSAKYILSVVNQSVPPPPFPYQIHLDPCYCVRGTWGREEMSQSPSEGRVTSLTISLDPRRGGGNTDIQVCIPMGEFPLGPATPYSFTYVWSWGLGEGSTWSPAGYYANSQHHSLSFLWCGSVSLNKQEVWKEVWGGCINFSHIYTDKQQVFPLWNI